MIIILVRRRKVSDRELAALRRGYAERRRRVWRCWGFRPLLPLDALRERSPEGLRQRHKSLLHLDALRERTSAFPDNFFIHGIIFAAIPSAERRK